MLTVMDNQPTRVTPTEGKLALDDRFRSTQ